MQVLEIGVLSSNQLEIINYENELLGWQPWRRWIDSDELVWSSPSKMGVKL